MRPCIIVASGPSAKGFIPPDDVTVFAVNGVIDWIGRADYWFTLDPSPANKKRMNNPRPGVQYFGAFNLRRHVDTPSHVRVLVRAESDKITTGDGRYTPQWWFDRWGCVAGISPDKNKIHSGNSAWGALQLAHHLGYRRALLIGVDASSEPRLEGGLTNDLCHLPLLFNSIGDDMDVVNCGFMDCDLPKMSIEDGLAWLEK